MRYLDMHFPGRTIALLLAEVRRLKRLVEGEGKMSAQADPFAVVVEDAVPRACGCLTEAE